MPQFVFSGYDSDGLIGGALDGGADKEKFYLVASARIGPKVSGINVGDFRAERFEDVSHLSFAPLPLQLALSVMKSAFLENSEEFNEMLAYVDPNTIIQRIHNAIPGNAAVGGLDMRGNEGALIVAKEWKDAVRAAYNSTKRKPKGFDPSLQKGKANCRTGGNAEFCWDIKLTKKMRNPNVYNKREKDLFDKCRDILESSPKTAGERDENVAELQQLIDDLNNRRAALEAMEAEDFDGVADDDDEQAAALPPPPPPPPPPPAPFAGRGGRGGRGAAAAGRGAAAAGRGAPLRRSPRVAAR